ncbi:AmiS/UreI family transporter [Arthrobacter sp. Soil764]|uniref:AmiS/UreI family transporter n=1 Tax=Arthrobacter sp. Soil764 TaxID=1736403 RepID=UPI0006F3A27A|nr:AmiS/UreI family transporter [Arthrobacter sp. Soil764]KRE91103.1 AmiS/UreI transporter [Arthrobacter sp. Soil764]
MPYICLLLSGAALLVNGLATLGHFPRRDAAVFSLVVGGTQLALGVVHVSTAGNAPAALLTAAGMFLFGVTYLYSGLDQLLALGGRGLGWFCGMVAFCGLLLAAAWLGPDPLLAVLWLCWSVLWALLFAGMALGAARLGPFTGWALVLTSQASATVPAVLGLAGLWPRSAAAIWLAALLLAGLFMAARTLARRGPQVPRRASTGDTLPAK